jgi:hypothetical protein
MKNKHKFAAILFILFAGTLPLIGHQEKGDRFSYRDTIVVARGETRDNVITVGGDVIVEGKVKKDVVAIGGTITVSGEVDDSVVGIGSKITLKATAVIHGDLVSLGGGVEKEPGHRIDGDTVYFKPSDITGKIFGGGVRGIFSLSLLPIILVFKFVSIFIWFMMTFLVSGLFPRQIALASNQVRTSFWPVFGTGLLALILYTIFIIIAAVLCLILIGIPILLFLAVAGFIVKIFGRVALFYFFGESLARGFNRQNVSALGGALLGLLFVSFIGFIPILGFLFTLCLSIIGWGVVIRTKFGTTENAFRRASKA